MERKPKTIEEAIQEIAPSGVVINRTPITVLSMLEAGAHFGHKVSDWNPKMASYLYGARNDRYIFNLDKTYECWIKAREVIVNFASQGKQILLVGTKRQCKALIKEESIRCGCHYVDNKWVGGLLTNFKVIKAAVDKMKSLDSFIEKVKDPNCSFPITKKEILLKERELNKLKKQLEGIRNLKSLPDLLVIFDIAEHHIAVKEAKSLHIPIVGVVDSNCNPNTIEYPIPANDDAIGSLALFISNICDAIIEGKKLYDEYIACQLKDRATFDETNQEYITSGEEANLERTTKEGIKIEKRGIKRQKKSIKQKQTLETVKAIN